MLVVLNAVIIAGSFVDLVIEGAGFCYAEVKEGAPKLTNGQIAELLQTAETIRTIFDCECDIEYAVKGMEVRTDAMDDPKYKLAFSVEKVNDLVSEGVPFRDAYRQVAASIQDGSFEFHGKLEHTHEGSIGNLCNDRVAARLEKVLEGFGFDKVRSAIAGLAGE